MRKLTVIFIIGPTAIGKTDFSIKLAKRVRGEIISADSMQAYRGMRILSQAPTSREKKTVRHHLVEFLDPRKEYSVASFRDKANRLIASMIDRKKTPIVAGGSGLYMKVLIDGLFPSPPADMKYRRSLARYIAKDGSAKLHKKLAAIDPVAASKIHPNDARRIIRALELYHSTGRTMTELKAQTHGLKDQYNIKIIGLMRPRNDIYKRIEDRIDRMFDENIVGEVKRLRKKRLSKTAKAVLGYKEIVGYLDGEYDIENARSLMKINTRHFAKRQMTWFRADERIKWFDLNKVNEEAVIKKIIKEIK
jgi:tRNA dimethylallyltransferase